MGWVRYDKTTSKIQKRRKKEGIDSIEQGIPSPETANLNSFRKHFAYLIPRLPNFFVLYSVDHAALGLLNYVGKQKADEKLVNVSIDGSYTPGKRARKKNLKRAGPYPYRWPETSSKEKRVDLVAVVSPDAKWRKSLTTIDSRTPLIAFGDAKFTQSMRGCKSGFFT
jgi:hypothetical protein